MTPSIACCCGIKSVPEDGADTDTEKALSRSKKWAESSPTSFVIFIGETLVHFTFLNWKVVNTNRRKILPIQLVHFVTLIWI